MNLRKTSWMLPALMSVSCAVAAEGVYVGARVGFMDPDVSGLDEAQNVGIVLGFEFMSDTLISAAVEAEFTTTYSDGDVDFAGLNGDWDVDTQALYLVGKLGEAFYGKLRAGVLREDVSISIGGISGEGSDSGFSAGLGVGWRAADNVSVEAEYTLVEEDIDFYSIGANIGF